MLLKILDTYIVNIIFIIIANFITKFNIFIKTIFHKGDSIVDTHCKNIKNKGRTSFLSKFHKFSLYTFTV